MEITVNENHELQIEKVYSGVLLVSDSKEELGICMRDTGFEFNYGGHWYEAKQGIVRRLDGTKNVTAENGG